MRKRVVSKPVAHHALLVVHLREAPSEVAEGMILTFSVAGSFSFPFQSCLQASKGMR